MQIQETVAPRQEQRAVEMHENEDSLLNSNDIITRVKVLTLWPSGRTERLKYILLLKNHYVASKNWQAVDNAVVEHEKLKPDILKAPLVCLQQ